MKYRINVAKVPEKFKAVVEAAILTKDDAAVKMAVSLLKKAGADDAIEVAPTGNVSLARQTLNTIAADQGFTPTLGAYVRAPSRETLENVLSLDGPTEENPTGLSKQTRAFVIDRGDGFRGVFMWERVTRAVKDSEGKTTGQEIVNTTTAYNREVAPEVAAE